MKNIRIVRDLRYTTPDQPDLALDLYLPADRSACPLLIFFHGGGLEAGNKADVADLASEFAWAGIAFASPDYRLYPQAVYPEFIEDAARAVAWLSRQGEQYGHFTGIFVGGHSAGAYLALMLALDRNWLARQDLAADAIAGYLPAGGQPTTHFNILKYRGDDPRRVVIDEAAPLYHVHQEGAPLQIICADQDIPNRLEQTQLLISTLRQFEYTSEVDFQLLKDHDHGSYLRIDAAGSSPMFRVASAFIDRHDIK